MPQNTSLVFTPAFKTSCRTCSAKLPGIFISGFLSFPVAICADSIKNEVISLMTSHIDFGFKMGACPLQGDSSSVNLEFTKLAPYPLGTFCIHLAQIAYMSDRLIDPASPRDHLPYALA